MNRLQKIDKKELEEKIKYINSLLSPCKLCPRNCRVNRSEDKRGFCKGGLLPAIGSFHSHFGEEPPISGRDGSGTIFFSNCNLRCVFCQNYPVSQSGEGKEISIENLTDIMIRLQSIGCHNINFVTPTHYAAQILAALLIAKERGLRIPLVYNCGGYESLEVLKILDGVIDIYMPDFKYGDNISAKKYSSAADYLEVVKLAIKEMYRQVGNLVIENGIAVKGLLVRHLVLPNNKASSKNVFEFISKEISPNVAVNIMGQYYPTHLAHKYPEIDRFLTIQEYKDTLRMANEVGLNYGWRQTMRTIEREKIPEWKDTLKDKR